MSGLIEIPNNTNFGPYISPWVTTGNDWKTGEPVFTELAQSFLPLVGNTPLTEIFPEEFIMERVVKIDQSFQPNDTIFPLVEMGKPDVVLGHNYGTTRSFYVQPLYIRRSSFISYGEINSKLAPGTMNTRWSPDEQIAMIVEGMVREHTLTWDVFRAMMLQGGIDYTDPRTGVPASVYAQIPGWNVWHYNQTSGYRGRNETNLFRTLIDSNAGGQSTVGVPWTHPDADIVACVQKFKRWFKETNKRIITAMYMSAEMKEVISMNSQVRLASGYSVARVGAIAGDNILADAGSLSADTYIGGLGINAEGIQSIAGIPIRTVETTFKNPVTGIHEKVWPKNKVVFVAQADVSGRIDPIGRTQFCVSEESGGQPGLWARTQPETQIPAAPGMYMQMGNAGMPYLKYPYAVAHMTVSEVGPINDRLGVVGDMNLGTW